MSFTKIFAVAIIVIAGVLAVTYLKHKLDTIDQQAIFENSLQNSMQIEKIKLQDSKRYGFHYIGCKEKWSNVFVLYRFDKLSGEILRYSYTIYEKEEFVNPRCDKVRVVNMSTGDADEFITSDYILSYYNFFTDAQKIKNTKIEKYKDAHARALAKNDTEAAEYFASQIKILQTEGNSKESKKRSKFGGILVECAEVIETADYITQKKASLQAEDESVKFTPEQLEAIENAKTRRLLEQKK